jgi:acyl-CoA reductase-like NAD-dependent aldehyde dehydrogenase
MAAGAKTMKRLLLELGGKGAASCSTTPTSTRPSGIGSVWGFHSGQICTAPTRAIVHRSRYDELVGKFTAYGRSDEGGRPDQMDTLVGPVISAAQRDRIEGYIGAGEKRAPRSWSTAATVDMERGFYVAPTLLADCRQGMTPVQEEIFGPVIVVVPFDDDDEGIAIANGTDFGLYDYVFSEDTDRAYRAARQLRSRQRRHQHRPAQPRNSVRRVQDERRRP